MSRSQQQHLVSISVLTMFHHFPPMSFSFPLSPSLLSLPPPSMFPPPQPTECEIQRVGRGRSGQDSSLVASLLHGDAGVDIRGGLRGSRPHRRSAAGELNDEGIDAYIEYWATRSSVRSHRSLVHLLRTARFARALHCAHSLTRSLTPLLVGQWMIGWLFCLCFFQRFGSGKF